MPGHSQAKRQEAAHCTRLFYRLLYRLFGAVLAGLLVAAGLFGVFMPSPSLLCVVGGNMAWAAWKGIEPWVARMDPQPLKAQAQRLRPCC